MSHSDKVVVFGGAGFIGRSLTKALLGQGNSVTVVSRSAGARLSTHPNLTYQTGTIGDASRVMELVEGADVVYDLALTGGQTWEDCKRETVGGALNVARACLKHKVRRAIYTSSIAALYLGRSGAKLSDSIENDGDNLTRGLYSRGKATAERALLELHAKEGLPVVIVRPAIVVGPGGALAHYALGDAVADTRLLGWGRGQNPLPFVLVDDVASAMVLAKDAAGVEGMAFNLVGDVRPTAEEFVKVLRQRTLRNFRFYPRSLYKIQAGELIRWGLKKLARKPNNVLNPYSDLKSLTMATQFDCSIGKRALGWNPVADREEFLRQAVDSLLEPIPPGDLRLSSASQGAGAQSSPATAH